MKHLLFFTISLLSFSVGYAKRLPPEMIEPIFCSGVIYKVVHYSIDQVEKMQNGGVIEMWSEKENKYLKSIIVYKTKTNNEIEKDVQEVFIKKMYISSNKKTIKIIAENGKKYNLNIKNEKVDEQ